MVTGRRPRVENEALTDETRSGRGRPAPITLAKAVKKKSATFSATWNRTMIVILKQCSVTEPPPPQLRLLTEN